MRFLSHGNGERGVSATAGFVRAFLIGLTVLAVSASITFRGAKARVHESLIAFGDLLSSWSNAKLDSRIGHLSINGVLVHHVTVSTPLGIDDALDRLEHICEERGGLEVPESLSKASSPGSERGLLHGVYRNVGKDLGLLACIETGRRLGVAELTRRLEQFVKTGDLSSIGQLRYVLARRGGDVTSLLVLWTDGSVPLSKMFPKTGDAPGRDVPDVPRPRDSDRLLSATNQAVPYGITVYRVRATHETSIQDWYSKTLNEQGWRVVARKGGSLVARRGERVILVHTKNAAFGNGMASIVELS